MLAKSLAAVKMTTKSNRQTITDINAEIESVYEYCLAAGLTHEEIIQKAGPLLKPLRKLEWKKRLMMLLKIAICWFALSYTMCCDYVPRSVLTNGRLLMFKILPLWDWTGLYSENCLVDNPLYIEEQVFITDCQACEDVVEVDYINETSPDEINQMYIQRNIPVIVKDVMMEWPVMKDSFNLLNLTEGYLFLNEDVCLFQSNLRVQNHHKLFNKLLKEDLQKWYAHWENCEKTSQKFLRKFYTQPYFMPNTVQMTESNYVFMSSGYYGKKFKAVNISSSITLMWAAQLRGYNGIRFEPKEPCDKTCNVLEDIIEEGEIVLFSPSVWSFSYLPGEGTENLALAAGGFAHYS